MTNQEIVAFEKDGERFTLCKKCKTPEVFKSKSKKIIEGIQFALDYGYKPITINRQGNDVIWSSKSPLIHTDTKILINLKKT